MILQSSQEDETVFHQASVEHIQKHLANKEAMLSRIYDDLLADVIVQSLYGRKKRELSKQRLKLMNELEKR